MAARGAGAPSQTPVQVPAPVVAPAAPPPIAHAVASTVRPRQAPIDTQPLRRSLAENRLDGVVVTGITSGAANQTAERTSVRSLQQPAAKAAAPVASAAPQAAAAMQAESPPPLPIIEGCFRVRTRARVDTLLVDPKILATDADSIRIQMNANNGFAWVRREPNGALVGRVWWQSTRTANMRADPIDCS